MFPTPTASCCRQCRDVRQCEAWTRDATGDLRTPLRSKNDDKDDDNGDRGGADEGVCLLKKEVVWAARSRATRGASVRAPLEIDALSRLSLAFGIAYSDVAVGSSKKARMQLFYHGWPFRIDYFDCLIALLSFWTVRLMDAH